MGNEIVLFNTYGGTTTRTSNSSKPQDQTTKFINEEIQKVLKGTKSDKPVNINPFMRTLSDKETEQIKNDGKLDETKAEEIRKKLKEQIGNFSDKSTDKAKKVHVIPHMRIMTDEDLKQRKEFEEFIKNNPKLSEEINKFNKDLLEKM